MPSKEEGTSPPWTAPEHFMDSNSLEAAEKLRGLEHFDHNYMDDNLIASYTETEHLEHIKQVFIWFIYWKMKLKLEKCEFFGIKFSS